MTAPPSLTSPPDTRRSRESDLIHGNDTSFSTIAFLLTSSCLLFPRMLKTTAGDHSGVPFHVRTHDTYGLVLHTAQHLHPNTNHPQRFRGIPWQRFLLIRLQAHPSRSVTANLNSPSIPTEPIRSKPHCFGTHTSHMIQEVFSGMKINASIEWMAGTTTRGIFSILSTVLSTVFICAWTVVHLNLLGIGEQKMKRLPRQVFAFIMADLNGFLSQHVCNFWMRARP